MRCQSILALLSVAAAVSAQQADPDVTEIVDAKVEDDSPAGAIYVATLPDEPFSTVDVEGNVKGAITAMTRPDGEGVLFTVVFSNLPKTGGPFGYHIHVDPVPEDGNCTKTLAHLDPFARGEDPACDPDAPETCQVGDLSGKYGKIPEGNDTFIATFTDPYVTLKEGPGAFFGNRSFVFHYANKTRITCANFESVSAGTSPSSTKDDCSADTKDDSDSSKTSESPSDSPAGQNGAAAAGISLVAAGFAAIMFAL